MVDFVSVPVTSGFTTAASITIASKQLSNLLGCHQASNNATISLPGILSTYAKLVLNIGNAHWPDALLGCTCLGILLAMRALPNMTFVKTKTGKYGPKVAWLLSISRNALVVLICTTFAYCLDTGLTLTGDIETGLPPITIPNYGMDQDFGALLQDIGPLIFTLPLVNILIQMSVAKSFCKY